MLRVDHRRPQHRGQHQHDHRHAQGGQGNPLAARCLAPRRSHRQQSGQHQRSQHHANITAANRIKRKSLHRTVVASSKTARHKCRR
jgi:hypothetical protein